MPRRRDSPLECPEASGALLVPGARAAADLRSGAIPRGATPVLSLDDTTIVSIDAPTAETVDPSPWRIRLAWDRNWTVLTSNLRARRRPRE